MDIIVYSQIEGLARKLESYRDLSVTAPSRIEAAQKLVQSTAPQALYIDDTRGTPVSDLWGLIQLAARGQVKVLVNMIGAGRAVLDEARVLGVSITSERDPNLIAAWIASALGVSAQVQGGSAMPVIAVGAAKGGIGKTFATCTLAETLRRRGLNVLVWDTDISNPGLVPAFRIPASAPSYLHLIQHGPSSWTPTGIKPFIYEAERTRATPEGWGRIDFLIGSHGVARAQDDVRFQDWKGLYQGVTQLDNYDVVLIDTPPDYLRRPYATHVLLSGGFVVLPTPPGPRERLGVGQMLDHFRESAPERMARCVLLFMEAERGVITTVDDIQVRFTQRYPEVRSLGTLPRAPRLASMADEHEDGYISMLDLGPNSPFSVSAHTSGNALCVQVGLTPRLPMPKVGMWRKLVGQVKGDRVKAPAVAASKVGPLAQQ